MVNDFERLGNDRRFYEYEYRVRSVLGWKYSGEVQEGWHEFPRGFPVIISRIPAENLLVNEMGDVTFKKW